MGVALKCLRSIAVVLAMVVPILSFACPVDDPATAYDESEAPISVATPATVNTVAQVIAKAALNVQPVVHLRVATSDHTSVKITVPILADSHPRLELLCTLLC